ncbi:FtsX-like permease family protein [Virgibacillus sp. YIM 98842]|uniref:FtsX-like permease family protein n=1 Tax=Virgibacillus sp. YIM 98842 TaxID=2663533 RepID=UPI0032049D1B
MAIVYVWSSGIVNLLAKRKEFAVLLSIGWRPSQLNRLLFIESSIVGLVVAFISWIMQMNDGYTVRKMV